MMDVDVTVCIVVQDEWGSLERTLQGLRKNTEYPYSLLIIDDGSRQQTHNCLSALEGVQRITNAREQGIPRCINLFIEQTDTPYLVLLESTAYVTQGWLTLLINCLKSRPEHGIAGPSTSWAWNEQQVIYRPNWPLSEIEAFGEQVRHQYADEIRYLDQLHSISDFCYTFKREVVERIGYFDERYDKGPCFEIDYNTRAAKAGYKCAWVCGAYVHRFPRLRIAILQESKFFQINKQLYQKKFCGLQLRRERKEFSDHCIGEACEHFAPKDLIQIQLPLAEVRKQTQNATQSTTCSETRNSKLQTANPRPETKSLPLISCIMPTYNRRLFVSQAIKYFLRQDYVNKELVIVDDGIDKVADLIPSDERIKYIRLEQKASIGYKRNLALEQSKGEIIAHWDDDDWYSENRISFQVQPLLQGNAKICGLDTGFLFNIVENTFWSCGPNLHARMFYANIHGGSIVYAKEVWEKYAKYPDASLAEDAAFLRAVSKKVRIVKLPNKNVFIYVRHDANAWEFICGKFIDPKAWERIDPPSFLSKEDLDFYEEVLSKLSMDSNTYKRIADSLRNGGNHTEALKYYDRALELDPTNIWALYDKGQTLNKLYRYEEALQAVLEADRLLGPQDNNRTWIHSELGKLYLQLGHKDQAKKEFETALHFNWKNQIAQESLKNMRL